MKVAYAQLVELDGVLEHVIDAAPRTVVFDVEPLVAIWDTDETSLVQGVTTILGRIAAETTGVQVVVFATNSRRQPPVVPECPGVRVLYLAAAAKPLRTKPYRSLPRPGVVVGDQVATDGVLAWRLGYSFLHLRPDPAIVPLSPRIMNHLGRPLRPLLFTRSR
jgi:predicted HAD superfamily phosphohydrolase YqeG